MSTTTTVTDNFLDPQYFAQLQTVFMSNEVVPWRLEPFVSNYGDEVNPYEHYFVCPIFYGLEVVEPKLHKLLMPLYQQLNVKALGRVRALCYPNQGQQIVHGKHVDSDSSIKACVFYLNTNDGFTEIENEGKVDSVENRALVFDGSIPHNSATCTNDKVRLVLNINYF